MFAAVLLLEIPTKFYSIIKLMGITWDALMLAILAVAILAIQR